MLRRLIPARYLESPEVQEIANALQPELDRMQDAIDDFMAQLLLVSATWGLHGWEQAYGLDSNVSQTPTERRDHVRSKLRGAGTVTTDALERIAAAFVAGDTHVSERPRDYAVDMLFNGVIGIPSNLADLQSMVRTMLPAHIDVNFLYRYLLVREVREMTVDTLQGQSISNFAFMR